ncbi:class D beta-lactamase [Zooshikella marina]|uniref:class D beta-lactamase n=1 Tax=Zooshikella ganghwensis TaxID=202772 RepID=UPI001BAF1D7B|nr:class D beta-lactamase [Zooshikella ganghwensis]MBU2708420.1 class D beta-lactamase [Zooshikella ganghwensis]
MKKTFKTKINLLIGTAILLTSFSSWATEDAKLSSIFNKYKINGTLVISSANGKTTYIHNKKRANKAFLPASTFKIPNTLIGLQEGAIKANNHLFKWDGEDKGWKIWNQNHTLKSALQNSCIWCYQEVAQDIGRLKYQQHLYKMSYGNQKLGDLTTFWLNGDLRITAYQEVEFLKKLYAEALPYKKEYQRKTKDIMIVENTPTYTLYGKTGWVMKEEKGMDIGWFVGFVKTKAAVWFYAINIDLIKSTDRQYRQKIVKEALKAKFII